MPLELLQALADDDLPMELHLTPDVQDKLRILHDAGHIICSFPPAEMAHLEPIRVYMVTPLGHKALRFFRPPEARRRNDDAAEFAQPSSALASFAATPSEPGVSRPPATSPGGDE
jgi:hypothetical protein